MKLCLDCGRRCSNKRMLCPFCGGRVEVIAMPEQPAVPKKPKPRKA